jgi:Co/Zn/Cd efflux system component
VVIFCVLTVTKLNDIISLLVGLWAVKAAQQVSSDKYSFGVSITTRMNEA